jgi:hypothetical protein
MTDQNKDQNDKTEQDRNASDKGDQQRDRTVPYARFTEVNEKRKAAEEELSKVADSLKEEVPEDQKDLIPDLPPAALIKWLRAATAKGLFSKAPPESPDGGKRPNSKKTEDLTGLSPQTLMARGYGQKK